MFIYSYSEKSVGARELGKELKAKRIKHEGSNFVGGPDKIIINWGAINVPTQVAKSKIVNKPEDIQACSNKLRFFQLVSYGYNCPRIPNFTTNPDEAKKWAADGKIVFARTILNASSGEGIEIIDWSNPDSFVEAPLYVEYVKKKDEYRIHFFNKKIFDFQRKALRPGFQVDLVNWKIRNLQNGFIYVRGNVELPEDVRLQAQRAIEKLPLDFGALDIIYNDASKKAYVLEVNTAPGLIGATCTAYANAFVEMFGKDED